MHRGLRGLSIAALLCAATAACQALLGEASVDPTTTLPADAASTDRAAPEGDAGPAAPRDGGPPCRTAWSTTFEGSAPTTEGSPFVAPTAGQGGGPALVAQGPANYAVSQLGAPQLKLPDGSAPPRIRVGGTFKIDLADSGTRALTMLSGSRGELSDGGETFYVDVRLRPSGDFEFKGTVGQIHDLTGAGTSSATWNHVALTFTPAEAGTDWTLELNGKPVASSTVVPPAGLPLALEVRGGIDWLDPPEARPTVTVDDLFVEVCPL